MNREVLARLERYGVNEGHVPRDRRPREAVPTDGPLYQGNGRIVERSSLYAHFRFRTDDLCAPPPTALTRARTLVDHPPADSDAAGVVAWKRLATSLTADLMNDPPSLAQQMPRVVAFATSTLNRTGSVRSYMSGWSLDRYRATNSIAWSL